MQSEPVIAFIFEYNYTIRNKFDLGVKNGRW